MKLLLTRTDLQTIGTRVIGAIIDNTSKGIDRFGKPFRKYSIKPFAMPYPAYLNFSTKASIKRNKKNESVSYFKRDGALFVVIKGGYNALKKERFQTGDNTVNLQVRGARGGGMLGELVTGDIKENSITVKFKTSEKTTAQYEYEAKMPQNEAERLAYQETLTSFIENIHPLTHAQFEQIIFQPIMH